MRNSEKGKTVFGLAGVMLGIMLSVFIFVNNIGFDKTMELCAKIIMPGNENNTAFIVEKKISNASSFLSSSKKNTDKKDETVKVNSLAYTPDDIEKIISSAQKTGEKGGKIEEKFYSSDSSNEKYGQLLIRNTTGRKMDYGELLKEKIDYRKPANNEKKVLIFHTHTSECYQESKLGYYFKDFSPRDSRKDRNMVRIGNEIENMLENAGIGVVHDINIYDGKYTGAYDRSGVGVDNILKKYPSIQVVLDVHRDAIQYDDGTKVAPTVTVNGKKSAQIMIITGCEGNGITDFPGWRKNLVFALKLQKKADTLYPGLVRPLFFCNRRYNMYKSNCSVLLEMGSDANTLDEAAYSGRLLGDVLVKLLKE